MKERGRRLALAALAVAAGVLIAACAMSVDPLTGRRAAFGYSWSEEIRIGAEADAEISAQYGVYNDPQLSAYVTRVGEAVLAQSHLRRPEASAEFRGTAFHFKVLDNSIVNAFALPGGYIYVTRGLLAHSENEAQLAVVIGHEIGHVVARHSSRRALKANLAQIGLQGGAILAQQVGINPDQVMALGSQAAQFIFLKYSRDDERQADALGVEYAAKAGYRTDEAAGFFHMLERMSEGHGSIPTWMSTHPDPGDRQQSMVRMCQEWRTQGFAQETVGQETLFGRLDGMILGDNPRQGFVENNTYYHPELRFSFPVPQGWQVQNTSAMVGLIDPQQQAQITFAQMEGATSAQAAANAFASQSGIQASRNELSDVNGIAAYAVDGQATSEGTVLAVRALFIPLGGSVYQFVAVTPQQNYSSFAGAFNTTMTGFRPLTETAILNVQPARIGIVQAPSASPFQRLLPSPLPRGISAEELALMNQVSLGDMIQRGTRVKLPR